MSSAKLLGQLALVCPSCDQFNPPGSAKCAACGAAFDQGAKPAPAPARPPPAPAPEAPPPAAAKAPPRTVSTPGAQAAPTQPVRTISSPAAAAAPPPQAAKPAAPAPAPARPAAPPAAGGSAPPNLRPARPAAAAAPPPAAPAPAVAKQPAAPARPPAAAKPEPAAPSSEPIPASELLKKPRQAAPAPAASTNAARYALVVVGGPTTGQRFRLAGAGFVLGRSRGAILFPDDPFVSAHHATFTVRENKLLVRDENSVSGIYVTIHGQETIAPGQLFCAGNRLFRFSGGIQPSPPQPGRPQVYGAPIPTAQSMFAVEEILVGGRPGRALATPAPLLTIGTGKCDLSYPNDDALAARHCELSPQLPQATLRDLSGGLGTFVRIAPGADRVLTPGDRLRIGEQIIEVETIG